jgi:MFS family permease
MQYMGQDAAVLAAGLMGVGLAGVMGADALRDYGWRIAFLAGAVIVPFGLVLRSGLTETLHAPEPEPTPAAGATRPYLRVALLGLAMLAAGTTVSYVLDYLTTYATATLHMPAQVAFGATVVLGITGLAFDPIGGWLSDRFGRKAVMVGPWCLLLVLILPCFWALAHFRTPLTLFAAAGLLTAAANIASASVLVAVSESLPRRIRSGTIALVYALAISVFGGSAQFNVAWLTGATHSALAPAWYMVVGVAVGLAAALAMRETAPGMDGRTALTRTT